MSVSTGSERAPRRGRLDLLLRIAETLNSGKGFQADLERVLALLAEELDASAVSLCVPEERGGGAELRVAFAERGVEMRTALLDVELSLREEVRRTGQPLRYEDATEEPRFQATVERRFGLEPRALVAVPLRRRESEVVGILFAVREEPRGFTRSDEVLLQTVADRLTAWVENDSLLRQLRQELEERELLLQVSREVGQTLDLDQVLDRVFEALQPVVPFDAAAIFLTDDDEDLVLGAQRGYGDSDAISLVPGDAGIIGLTRRLRRGVLIAQVDGHPDYLEARPSTQSEMAVPISSAGRIVGVINLESDRPGFYNERHLRVAELIAAHVGSAIANARLHHSQLRQLQVDHELGLAREIQLSLLPDRPPNTPELELAAINVPSSEVGGDYYDYLQLEDQRLALILADVSGHGLSAALLTASMRIGFRILAREDAEPAAIARRLSAVLFESTPANQYVAAVIVVLDLQTGTARYTNAGHVPPLLVQGGKVDRMMGGGVPLGVFANSAYESRDVQLTTGALLALYTDGISEAEDRHGDQFGIDGMEEVLTNHRSADPRQVLNQVRLAVRRHRGRRGGHQDDITLVVARWKGPSA